jgi:large subunit ribosomal protein L29
MNASDLRKQSSKELEKALLELRQEQFNLRMQRSSGQLSNPARFKAVQKDIARVKTVQSEQASTTAGAE